MIPHRMLSNDISGSGLRNRVTACRKRLRENRTTVKSQACEDVEQVLQEEHMNRSPFEDENGTLLQIEEPEVGIT